MEKPKEIVNDNPKDKIEYEIGDTKQPDFKPQVKLMRWDNEVNLSVRLDEEFASEPTKDKDKLVLDKADKTLNFYQLPQSPELPEGGFEFEVVLKEKPASNVLNFTLNTKELDFFYQPELTQEEIDQGSVRPENVVGSYAVYHKTKKNNRVGGMEYKAGKAFHIYRPFAEDSDGTKVWCDLDVTEGNLSVTVPQDFLDKAVYPVLVDPTFGYTSIGGTGPTAATGTTLAGGCLFTLGEDGEVTEISAYWQNTADRLGQAGIYDNDWNLVATGTETNCAAAASWKNLPISAALTAADYRLWLFTQSVGAGYGLFWDAGSTAQTRVQTGTSYSTWPDPLVPNVSLDRQVSIYATYTAGAGGGGGSDPVPVMSNGLFWNSVNR